MSKEVQSNVASVKTSMGTDEPRVFAENKSLVVRRRNTLDLSGSMNSSRNVLESSTPRRGVPESISSSVKESTVNNDDANSSCSLDNFNHWSSSDLPLSECRAKSPDDTSTTSSCSSGLPSVITVTLEQILSRKDASKNTQKIEGTQTVNNGETSRSTNKNMNNGSSLISKRDCVNGIPRRGSQPVMFSLTDNEELRVRNREEPVPSPSALVSSSSTLSSSSLSSPTTVPENFRNFLHPVRVPGKISESTEWSLKKKQKQLVDLVLSVWPQHRIPTPKYIVANLSPETLERRRMLSPLIVGIIIVKDKKQMVRSATVTNTKYMTFDNYHKPSITTDICDTREYLIKHCPTFQNPPLDELSPGSGWTEKFLLTQVLPRLAEEVSIVQQQPGLLLTVKEVKMRGLEENELFECRLCADNYAKIFSYKGIIKHLNSPRHSNIKCVSEEDHIKINLKEYLLAFSKNLPPRIIRQSTT